MRFNDNGGRVNYEPNRFGEALEESALTSASAPDCRQRPATIVYDYYVSPTFLRGEPGLVVDSEASTLHNLNIPALGIDEDIAPRGKVQVDITFLASGVLTFSCKFHGPLGMNGQLLAGDATLGGGR